MCPDDEVPDASVVPQSPTGVFLCPEPCDLQGACRNGILAARMEGDSAVVYDLECPEDFREGQGLAHTSWTAGVVSEMCGQLSLWLGTIAFTGTITTRYQAPIRTGERLIGRVTLEGQERRKLFVAATLTSTVTGTEVATGSGIAITAELSDFEARGQT
jgi:acyl dehydratase